MGALPTRTYQLVAKMPPETAPSTRIRRALAPRAVRLGRAKASWVDVDSPLKHRGIDRIGTLANKINNHLRMDGAIWIAEQGGWKLTDLFFPVSPASIWE